MKIDFANLQYQYQLYKSEIDGAIQSVLNKSNYIMGEEISQLEIGLEEFTGANHAITCSNGTDALLLAMMALNIKPGDEIITPPFTFIATAETIAFMGAKPVFADIDERTYNINPSKIEEKITSKTKAIMPVSLFGQPADIDSIQEIANNHNLKVIIDGAQSFGSTYKGKTDSNLSDISTTSFFPAKPLGCYGDGGAVFTNNTELAEKIKQLRVHGQNKRYQHKYIGMGGRLDTIQAAILMTKLKYYDNELMLRQKVAEQYTRALANTEIILPFIENYNSSVWAQYSIRIKNRDEIKISLQEKGIPAAIHYPTPLHLQECFKYLGHSAGDFPVSELVSNEILSLPMNAFLLDEEISHICNYLHESLEQ
jgi:UDP-2-acetamido-2-deoxy-ribo-hexuluronate aminotransferase